MEKLLRGGNEKEAVDLGEKKGNVGNGKARVDEDRCDGGMEGETDGCEDKGEEDGKDKVGEAKDVEDEGVVSMKMKLRVVRMGRMERMWRILEARTAPWLSTMEVVPGLPRLTWA